MSIKTTKQNATFFILNSDQKYLLSLQLCEHIFMTVPYETTRDGDSDGDEQMGFNQTQFD